MDLAGGRWSGLKRRFLSCRWWPIAVVSLVGLVVEIDEHQPHTSHIPTSFLREVVLFAAFVPALVGVVLPLMSRSRHPSELARGAAEFGRRGLHRTRMIPSPNPLTNLLNIGTQSRHDG